MAGKKPNSSNAKSLKSTKSEFKKNRRNTPITCISCGENKKSVDFYASASVYHAGTGRLPICKLCIKKLSSNDKGFIDVEKFKNVLKELDKPFLYDVLQSAYNEAVNGEKGEGKDIIGTYFKNVNSLPQYKSLTYADSEFEPKVEFKNPDLDLDALNQIESDFELTPEIIKFWGNFKDYTNSDYEFLQENYESWLRECKSDTLAEKKLYKQICLQELEIQKLREAGKSVVKETETLQKLMDSANVKPKDINAANDPSNANVLGMIIKDIETYRPAEYFEDKKLFADFDSIKDYWQRFVTRPLKNLLLGTRDADKEFNLDSNIGDDDG